MGRPRHDQTITHAHASSRGLSCRRRNSICYRRYGAPHRDVILKDPLTSPVHIRPQITHAHTPHNKHMTYTPTHGPIVDIHISALSDLGARPLKFRSTCHSFRTGRATEGVLPEGHSELENYGLERERLIYTRACFKDLILFEYACFQ